MSLTMKVFGKRGCSLCENAKNVASLRGWIVEVQFYDIGTEEGAAEMDMNDIMNIPAVILYGDEVELGRWDGEVPSVDVLGDTVRDKFPKEQPDA